MTILAHSKSEDCILQQGDCCKASKPYVCMRAWKGV
jgi:hypothetical protein